MSTQNCLMASAKFPSVSKAGAANVSKKVPCPFRSSLFCLRYSRQTALSSPSIGSKASSGMPAFQQCGRRPEQAVAHLDVVVEERERLARLQGLHPEADLAQLDRHRVEVHAVDATADDVALGVLDRAQARLVVARAEPGQLLGHPLGRGDQEVAAAAGRVADLQVEQGLFGLRLARASRTTGSRAESSRQLINEVGV